MYGVVRTKLFERSYQKLKESGLLKSVLKQEIEDVIAALADGKKLAMSYKDHALKGELQAFRECHIRGDLLLVYEKRDTQLVLILVDIGGHSHLFG